MFKIKLAENIKVNNFFNNIIIEGFLGKVKKNKKNYINVFYYKGFSITGPKLRYLRAVPEVGTE